MRRPLNIMKRPQSIKITGDSGVAKGNLKGLSDLFEESPIMKKLQSTLNHILT